MRLLRMPDAGLRSMGQGVLSLQSNIYSPCLCIDEAGLQLVWSNSSSRWQAIDLVAVVPAIRARVCEYPSLVCSTIFHNHTHKYRVDVQSEPRLSKVNNFLVICKPSQQIVLKLFTEIGFKRCPTGSSTTSKHEVRLLYVRSTNIWACTYNSTQ